jgi:hypothetical protein
MPGLESRQTLSDRVVQPAMQFEHRCAIVLGDFVDLHGNLDHGAIERAENSKESVDAPGWDAVGTETSRWSVWWLVHRMASLN